MQVVALGSRTSDDELTDDDYAATTLVVTHAYLQERAIALTDLHPVYPIKCVRYVGGPTITEIGRPTIGNKGFYGVTKIELHDFDAVQIIGFDFVTECESLESIDLSAIHNAKFISGHFLGECTALTSVDLSPLSNVTELGGAFMLGCTALTAINLTPLSNLKYPFLSICTSLESPVDLTPFKNIQHIGSCFMSHCSSLTSIDLLPFSNVTRIGDCFMTHCSALTAIGLEPFRGSLIEFGDSFLEGCLSLRSVNLEPLNGVTGAGTKLLMGCGRVDIVDQEHLGDVLKLALRGRSRKCTIL